MYTEIAEEVESGFAISPKVLFLSFVIYFMVLFDFLTVLIALLQFLNI